MWFSWSVWVGIALGTTVTLSCSVGSELDTTKTQIVEYRPSAAGVDLSRSGECAGRSVAAGWREDAWRCIVDSTVHDPCFEVGTDVICEADPFETSDAFVVNLAAPLPQLESSEEASEGYWLLELTTGEVCRFAAGATGGVEDARANYLCSDGKWVAGGVQDGSPLHVDVAEINEILDPSFSLSDAARVGVAKAWR